MTAWRSAGKAALASGSLTPALLRTGRPAAPAGSAAAGQDGLPEHQTARLAWHLQSGFSGSAAATARCPRAARSAGRGRQERAADTMAAAPVRDRAWTASLTRSVVIG